MENMENLRNATGAKPTALETSHRICYTLPIFHGNLQQNLAAAPAAA
jgi:hypothetical protein